MVAERRARGGRRSARSGSPVTWSVSVCDRHALNLACARRGRRQTAFEAACSRPTSSWRSASVRVVSSRSPASSAAQLRAPAQSLGRRDGSSSAFSPKRALPSGSAGRSRAPPGRAAGEARSSAVRQSSCRIAVIAAVTASDVGWSGIRISSVPNFGCGRMSHQNACVVGADAEPHEVVDERLPLLVGRERGRGAAPGQLRASTSARFDRSAGLLAPEIGRVRR